MLEDLSAGHTFAFFKELIIKEFLLSRWRSTAEALYPARMAVLLQDTIWLAILSCLFSLTSPTELILLAIDVQTLCPLPTRRDLHRTHVGP